MKKTPHNTRFNVLMVLVTFVVLGGQGISLYSLVDYNRRKTDWDSRKDLRNQLRADLDALQKRRGDIEADTLEAENRNANAVQAASNATAKVQAAEQTRRKAQDDMARARAQTQQQIALEETTSDKITKLREQVASLSKSVQESKAEAFNLDDKNNVLKTQEAYLVQKVQNFQDKLTSINGKLDDSQQKLITARKGLADVQPQLQEANARINEADTLRRDLATSRNNKFALKAATDALEKKKAEMTVRVDGLDQSKTNLNKEIGDLQATEKKLQTSTQSLSRTVGRLEAQEAALEPAVQDLLDKKIHLKTSKATLEAAVQDMTADEAKAKEFRQEVVRLAAQQGALEADLKNTKTRLDAIKTDLSKQNTLRTTIADLKDQRDSLQAEVDQARNNLRNLRDTANADITKSLKELAKAVAEAVRSTQEKPAADTTQEEGN